MSTGPKGIFEALIKAVEAVPAGADILVICRLEYVTNYLRDWEKLRARSFTRPKGKEPYIDIVELRKVDAILQAKGITITGRPPAGDEMDRLKSLQNWASEIATNIGNDPGSWGAT